MIAQDVITKFNHKKCEGDFFPVFRCCAVLSNVGEDPRFSAGQSNPKSIRLAAPQKKSNRQILGVTNTMSLLMLCSALRKCGEAKL